MFHKRSTNIQISNQNGTKTIPILAYQKRSFLFGPVEQILDQIETICFQEDKFGKDTKTFGFVPEW